MSESANGKKGFGPYLGLTAMIGFGFFSISLMDMLYDTYVPKFLETYVDSATLRGLIMTLDNVLQLLLLPFIAAWSDKTVTRLGRRMPFIMAMLPAAALCFAFVPYAWAHSLAALIAILFLLNVFKTGVRGPVVALMPDTIPGEFRSEANGTINTMGGLGSIVSSLVLGTMLFDVRLPALGGLNGSLSFLVAAGAVVAAVLVLLAFVRERQREVGDAGERIPLKTSLKAVFGSEDKSALMILASIFLWFCAYEGVKPLLTIYGTTILGQSSGTAALPSALAGIAYAITAIPSGMLARRIGRKKVIRGSLAAMLALFAAMGVLAAIGPGPALSGSTLFWVLTAMMAAFGVCWGSVITNSFPMLWQMATFGNIGMFTGLYYVASQSASILAPPLTGAVVDLLGLWFSGANASGAIGPTSQAYAGSFAFSILCVALALVTMGMVRKGEPKDAALEVKA